MKRDIILAGIGGQGILTTARLLVTAAATEGLHVKQTEVHGMSQRGGSVESHIRISSDPIFSALIPSGFCDLIIATEPAEALRHAAFLSKDGSVVSGLGTAGAARQDPAAAELEKLGGSLNGTVQTADCSALAKEAGSAYSLNTALLGAAAPLTGLKPDSFLAAIATVFKAKGENVIAVNQKAFQLGLERGNLKIPQPR